MVGGVSNYILNRIWTFGSRRNPLVEGLQFLTVSAVALLFGKIVFDAGRAHGFHHFTIDLVRRDARRHVRQLLPQQVLDVPPPQLTQAALASGPARASSLLAAALRLHGIGNPAPRPSGLAPGRYRGDRAQLRAPAVQHHVSADDVQRTAAELRRAGTADRSVPRRHALQALRHSRDLRAPDRARVQPGTIVTIAYFARWLFGSALAGLIAAFFYAVFPGSVYYGRTFMPDYGDGLLPHRGTLCDGAHILTGDRLSPRRSPMADRAADARLSRQAGRRARARAARRVDRRALCRTPAGAASGRYAILVVAPAAGPVALRPPRRLVRGVALGQRHHAASRIYRRCEPPSPEPRAFVAKLGQLRIVLRHAARHDARRRSDFLLSLAAFIALPWTGARSKALLWGWLAGALAIRLRRRDGRARRLLPAIRFFRSARWRSAVRSGARLAAVLGRRRRAGGALRTACRDSRSSPPRCSCKAPRPIAAYYSYNPQAYRNAVALDGALPQGALVVIGHYGPDVQYYIDRFGWEEDPLSLDAVRRRERDRQRRALLHLHRRRPAAPQSRALRVAARFPVVAGPRPLARLSNGSRANLAQRRIVLASLSPGRTRRSGARLSRRARRLRDAS